MKRKTRTKEKEEAEQKAVHYKDIPFERIRAFHMDEYIGLPATAPQRLGNFLYEHIFGLLAKTGRPEVGPYGCIILP